MYKRIKEIIPQGMGSHVIKRMYLTVVMFVVGVVVISGGIMYLTFKNLGISIISNNNQENIEQLSKTVETVSNTGHNLVLEVFQDKDVQPLLFGYNPEAYEISRGLNRLDRYKQSTPFVHSIYTYNRKRDEFYTTLPSEGIKGEDEFYDKDIIKFMNGEITYDLRYPIIRTIEDRTRAGNNPSTKSVYTFIIYNNHYSGEAKSMDNVVVVNIAQDWVRELITNNNKNQKESIFIIDEDGALISHMKGKELLSDLISYDYIKEIVANENTSDSFTEKIDNTQMLISYTSINDLPKWIIVKMSDYSEVMAPLKSIKNITMWVLAIAILITSLLALFVSKTLYKPVKHLEGYVKSLKKEKRQGFYEMQQSFLVGLVNGRTAYSQQDLDDRFKQYKISLDTSVESKIILMKIDDYKKFTEQNTKSNQKLLQYSIVNITEEIGNQLFNCSVVDLSDGLFANIINIDLKWSEAEFDEYIKDCISEIQKTVEDLLNITISFVLGDVVEDFSMVSEIYKEAYRALRYNKFYKQESIINIEDIYEIEKNDYIYSDKEYDLLFMNLKQGKIHEAKKLYEKITSEVMNFSYTAYESTVLHLAYSINLIIGSLNDQNMGQIDYNPSKLIQDILNAEYSFEIDHLFMAVFDKIDYFIKAINESKKDNDNNELIQSIYRIIDEEYMDINIDIQSIAGQVDMSGPYLGRLFTDHTGSTITQCINDKRLKRASDLLINTDEVISVISDKCGFSNATYFYKKFKQMYNMTPSKYRNTHRS